MPWDASEWCDVAWRLDLVHAAIVNEIGLCGAQSWSSESEVTCACAGLSSVGHNGCSASVMHRHTVQPKARHALSRNAVEAAHLAKDLASESRGELLLGLLLHSSDVAAAAPRHQRLTTLGADCIETDSLTKVP